ACGPAGDGERLGHLPRDRWQRVRIPEGVRADRRRALARAGATLRRPRARPDRAPRARPLLPVDRRRRGRTFRRRLSRRARRLPGARQLGLIRRLDRAPQRMSGREQYDIGSLELVVSRERQTETFGQPSSPHSQTNSQFELSAGSTRDARSRILWLTSLSSSLMVRSRSPAYIDTTCDYRQKIYAKHIVCQVLKNLGNGGSSRTTPRFCSAS